jgi:hypothetical protein
VADGPVVLLYRAVSLLEFERVMRTGRFTPMPGSLAGKFFAESPEHAARWGDHLEGPGNFRILEVEVLAATADTFRRWPRLDGVGPARYAELRDLEGVVIREVGL